MSGILHFIESKANPIFLIAMALGFVMPWVEHLPQDTVSVLLAFTIFLGCTRLSLDHMRAVKPATALWFIILRYLVIPVAVFYLSGFFVSDMMSVAALLIILAPSGVVSAALTGMLRGNVAFSLLVTLASHLLFIISAPLLLSTLAGKAVTIDAMSLLLRLCWMIIVPLLACFALNRMAPMTVQKIKPVAAAWSVILITISIVVIVAQIKHHIFENPSLLVEGFVWITFIFALNYLVFGWMLGHRQPRDIQNAMAVCSGANNTALTIVLAVLYFPPQVTVLMVIAEIIWIIALPLYRMFYARAERG
ncbi:MAG: hypothetical protein EB059_07825 [Alphaproteobacteria bacterium]|nr:hypothetical protein [Alphaproteobacteria bacterium]